MQTVTSRIANLRDRVTGDGKPLLSIFFTVGYPAGVDPVLLAQELEGRGVEMLELGLPFSDPIADGPVIQRSSQEALEAGMSLERYFSLLSPLRERVSVPVFFMGYLNSVLQFGVERFCDALGAVGVDGVIIPDLPLEIYERSYQEIFRRHRIAVSFLITPRTPRARLVALDAATTGFLYAVCQPGVTGGDTEISGEALSWLGALKTASPVIAGFGFRRQAQLAALNGCAKGAIVGSEFIRHLGLYPPINRACEEFFRAWQS